MNTGPHSATSDLLSAPAESHPPVSAQWRRRRMWVSRWRRLTRWEYWPRWAVYAPVVVYMLWLALRHRSLTVFSAVNPSMPAASGLVGLSKAEILQGLGTAEDRIARWVLVPPGRFAERNATVRRFMAENDLGYPVVLKPDRGERGAGVVIARDAWQVEAALRATAGPIMAQAYVPGVEFGVFYVRDPAGGEGEIFAVTEKRDVAVVGDGQQSLEALILADDRAVGMARYFLAEFADRLAEVPAAGERVRLSEIGTHCRGALFLEGIGLVTAQLTQAVDEVSRAYAGFYFGRYDVKSDSIEAFQRGEFKVIELNGVTSEATSIYDPQYSVWHGWRVLGQQWRLAFRIGAINRRRGARVWSPRELWQLWQEHRRA